MFQTHFPSIQVTPTVVYPGINLAAYDVQAVDPSDPDVAQVVSYVITYSSRFLADS